MNSEEFKKLELVAEQIAELKTSPPILWGVPYANVVGVIVYAQTVASQDPYAYIMFGAVAKRAIVVVMEDEENRETSLIKAWRKASPQEREHFAKQLGIAPGTITPIIP